MVPQCPLCRERVRARDIQTPRPLTSGKVAQIQGMLKEPAYARIAEGQRPLRSSWRIVIVERQERQQALDNLIRERERLIGSQQGVISEPSGPLAIKSGRSSQDVISEPVAGPSGTQVPRRTSSDSDRSLRPSVKPKFKPVLESEESSSQFSSITSQSKLVIDSQASSRSTIDERGPEIVHHRPGQWFQHPREPGGIQC